MGKPTGTASPPGARQAWGVCVLVCIAAGCSRHAVDEPHVPAGRLRPDYDPAVHDADPIKEFGVARSEPIHTGYFFHKHRYVEGPYVVERRGLAVYVNGVKMGDAQEWPPFDETVDEDPGDPPPGSSPLDDTPPRTDYRDDYWNRKWRYLEQHHDFDTAFRLMVRTYRKCRELRRVKTSWRMPGSVTLVDRQGRDLPVVYFPSRGGRPVTRDAILARAEDTRTHYERWLKSGCYVGRDSGFASEMGPRIALPMMEVLLSDRPEDAKIAALEKALRGPVDESDLRTLRAFVFSADLAAKVERARRAATK